MNFHPKIAFMRARATVYSNPIFSPKKQNTIRGDLYSISRVKSGKLSTPSRHLPGDLWVWGMEANKKTLNEQGWMDRAPCLP
jgi:hypothetical protein